MQPAIITALREGSLAEGRPMHARARANRCSLVPCVNAVLGPLPRCVLACRSKRTEGRERPTYVFELEREARASRPRDGPLVKGAPRPALNAARPACLAVIASSWLLPLLTPGPVSLHLPIRQRASARSCTMCATCWRWDHTRRSGEQGGVGQGDAHHLFVGSLGPASVATSIQHGSPCGECFHRVCPALHHLPALLIPSLPREMFTDGYNDAGER